MRCLPGLTVVCAVVFSMTFLSAARLGADVKPHSLISDHMVIQRGMRTPVWGTAEPGERVTVSIAAQSAKTTADKTGSWMVKLKPMKAGGPHEMTIAGKNTIKLKNVMVGEHRFVRIADLPQNEPAVQEFQEWIIKGIEAAG